jgi:hypothetical protein
LSTLLSEVGALWSGALSRPLTPPRSKLRYSQPRGRAVESTPTHRRSTLPLGRASAAQKLLELMQLLEDIAIRLL